MNGIDRQSDRIKYFAFFDAFDGCSMLLGTKKWHDESLHKKTKKILSSILHEVEPERERKREREREREKKYLDNYTLLADDIKCLIFDWYSSHRHFFLGDIRELGKTRRLP